MDFIEQLPLSGGFTAILIIVDHLSKQGIFIPTVDIHRLQRAHAPVHHAHLFQAQCPEPHHV